LGDLWVLTVLFMIVLTAALIAHKIAKHSPLRNMAPNWVSWDAGKKFPMGLALGPTLAIYLGLGTLYGS
jgi:prepilin peptidase CpaA